jgi:uncharacterized membrane protein
MRAPRPEAYYSALDPRRAAGRMILAALIGAGVGFFLPSEHSWAVRTVAGWDAGAMTLLLFVWWIIWASDPRETRCRAASADPGRTAVWFIVLIASCFSLFAGAVVLRHARSIDPERSALLVILCIIAIVAAWALTHTSYTLRYAHLYYRDDDEGEGGLTFPGERKPDDFDFAYFAYTVGMCFQVSDVSISSPQIRRAVLGQAILSFAYNTVILALALNLLFGFLN